MAPEVLVFWSKSICSEHFLEELLLPPLLVLVLATALLFSWFVELQHESEINCVLSRGELMVCTSCGWLSLFPIPLILLATGAWPLSMVSWLYGFILLSLSPLSFGGVEGSFPLSHSMFLWGSITAGLFNSLRAQGDSTPQDGTVNTLTHTYIAPETLNISIPLNCAENPKSTSILILPCSSTRHLSYLGT